MKKIKWHNVLKFLILCWCLYHIVYDTWIIAFSHFFTGYIVGFTWFGLFLYIIAWGYAFVIIQDFKEQLDYIEKRRNRRK